MKTKGADKPACYVLLFISFILAIGAFFITSATTLSAATIVVNTSADERNQNGRCSLREAMINADQDDQSGSTDCIAGNGADTITFIGLSNIMLNQNLPTITSADGLTIDGFKFGGLNFPNILSSGTHRIGPAFTTSESGSLTLNNLTVGNFVGPDRGGGAINNSGKITLRNCGFSNNSISAIANSGDLIITDSTFDFNHAPTGFGGAILHFEGTLTITGSTFSSNDAAFGGGAISISYNGIVVVVNSTFSRNRVTSFDPNHLPDGAAIDVIGSRAVGGIGALTVSGSTFSENIVERGGAAISNRGGAVTVNNSTFSQNGGGINNSSGGTVAIANTTFSNNTGFLGGAINNGSFMTVTNSTFAGNRENAIYNDVHGMLSVNFSTMAENGSIVNERGGDVTLRSTIVRNSPCFFFSQITDGGFNIENGTSCRFSAENHSQPNTDPGLDPRGLRDNGGPTQTIALLGGAGPAIDAIPISDCTGGAALPNPLRSDQRGFSRPADGNTASCDIGAFEANAAELQIVNEFVEFVRANERGDIGSGCPSGYESRFRFDGFLTSKPGSPPLSNLEARVSILTNGNLVENTDGGFGGVGATVPFFSIGGLSDEVLAAGESVRLPFNICLRDDNKFVYFVDVLGVKE